MLMLNMKIKKKIKNFIRSILLVVVAASFIYILRIWKWITFLRYFLLSQQVPVSFQSKCKKQGRSQNLKEVP